MPQVPLDAFRKCLLRKCLIAIPHIWSVVCDFFCWFLGFFSLDKDLACLRLLNILSSCEFLAGICVKNHAKQSLQMLTSSSMWLSQWRVCALLPPQPPFPKIPKPSPFYMLLPWEYELKQLCKKGFFQPELKKVLIRCSTGWCHCPARPPGAPVQLED